MEEASDDQSILDLSQLFLGRRIARGAEGRVHRARYKDQPVAVKVITVPHQKKDDEAMAARLENQFNREVSLLSRIHHPNVLKFVAACRKPPVSVADPPVFYLVTEYLPEGSLRALLHRLKHQTLPLEDTVAMALDIARGMKFIHDQGIIHRDLKPENILIDAEFHMKIADFGSACEETNFNASKEYQGTLRWMAPEMIRHNPYGKKVDVYSFGLILCELISGSIPFEGMTPVQVAFAVDSRNSRPPILPNCPPAMKALIEQCWSSKPNKRPEFSLVVKVLEEFEISLARHGTLSSTHYQVCNQVHNKGGLLHWIRKLAPPCAHPPMLPFGRLSRPKLQEVF